MNKSEKNFVITISFLLLVLAVLINYHHNSEEIKKERIEIEGEIAQKEKFYERERKIESAKQNSKRRTYTEQNYNTEDDTFENTYIKNIPVNPPTPLSYKSREEVLNSRTHYVMNSIFRNPDYRPSNEVFEMVESNKPWVSNKQCKNKHNNESDIEGPSEEARFINNPEVLVAIEYAFYGHYCDNLKPKFIESQFPYSITYDRNKNEITTKQTYLPYCDSNGKLWYGLKGINARDLGYKYAYLDLEKSTFKPHFKESINISNSIVEFQDFLHVGGSCGVPGGCNNGSPDQPPLNFYYPCTGEEGVRAKNRTLYIKFWKERPNSPQQTPDITQKIIIRSVKVPPGE